MYVRTNNAPYEVVGGPSNRRCVGFVLRTKGREGSSTRRDPEGVESPW